MFVYVSIVLLVLVNISAQQENENDHFERNCDDQILSNKSCCFQTDSILTLSKMATRHAAQSLAYSYASLHASSVLFTDSMTAAYTVLQHSMIVARASIYTTSDCRIANDVQQSFIYFSQKLTESALAARNNSKLHSDMYEWAVEAANEAETYARMANTILTYTCCEITAELIEVVRETQLFSNAATGIIPLVNQTLTDGNKLVSLCSATEATIRSYAASISKVSQDYCCKINNSHIRNAAYVDFSQKIVDGAKKLKDSYWQSATELDDLLSSEIFMNIRPFKPIGLSICASQCGNIVLSCCSEEECCSEQTACKTAHDFEMELRQSKLITDLIRRNSIYPRNLFRSMDATVNAVQAVLNIVPNVAKLIVTTRSCCTSKNKTGRHSWVKSVIPNVTVGINRIAESITSIRNCSRQIKTESLIDDLVFYFGQSKNIRNSLQITNSNYYSRCCSTNCCDPASNEECCEFSDIITSLNERFYSYYYDNGLIDAYHNNEHGLASISFSYLNKINKQTIGNIYKDIISKQTVTVQLNNCCAC